MKSDLITIDVILKYVVLIAFTLYIGACICAKAFFKVDINLPDWMISLFTIVFMYFFRRAPKDDSVNKT